MRGIAAVRRLVRNKPLAALVSSCSGAEVISSNSCSRSSVSLLRSMVTSTTASIASFRSSPSSKRYFCASSSGPSNIVLIDSEDQLNTTLRKVQDESLPAVFYFTANWCGPCKMIYPIIEQLSLIYPHVTTYKIDIDQEGLGDALSNLEIYSVPTFHLYKNGKNKSQITGADSQKLRDTMEALYK